MQFAALDGRTIDVRRRWIPWRPRARKFDGIDAFNIVGGAEDPISFVGLFVLAIVLALFGGIILTVAVLASEVLLLIALLIPLLVVARTFWLLPWAIEARSGDTVLGVTGVRGWRASEEAIRDLGAAYQRGENPFEVKDYSVGP